MKRTRLRFGRGFRVAMGNSRAQAAEMVIPPGEAEGSSENRHRGADQWLYVVSGTGSALVNGKRFALGPGSLMLIEHGDKHQIRNSGRELLRTLNFYVPPAYTKSGNEPPPGKPWGRPFQVKNTLPAARTS